MLSRPRNTQHLRRRSLLRALAGLCSAGGRPAAAAKLNRIWLGARHKHLRYVADRLWLEQHDDMSWSAYWNGVRCAELESLAAAKGVAHDTPVEDVGIVLSGPSAAALDLGALRGGPIIAGNGAIALLDTHGIAATHFVATDVVFFEHRMPLVRRAVEMGARCFVSANGVARIAELDPALFQQGQFHLLEMVNRFYGLPQWAPGVGTPHSFDWWQVSAGQGERTWDVGFSHDVAKGVFTGRTVAYVAAQLAIWLGYYRLQFIGLDLGGNRRVYDEAGAPRPSSLDKDYASFIEPSFELLAQVAQGKGIETVNLSAASRLPSSLMPRAERLR